MTLPASAKIAAEASSIPVPRRQNGCAENEAENAAGEENREEKSIANHDSKFGHSLFDSLNAS